MVLTFHINNKIICKSSSNILKERLNSIIDNLFSKTSLFSIIEYSISVYMKINNLLTFSLL